ncbi:UNVERIFIED_CONTAM: hypothetical protein FKN15_063703 [Acipenser sinensis]
MRPVVWTSPVRVQAILLPTKDGSSQGTAHNWPSDARGKGGPSTTTETETIAKYEIMDGAPVKGESIPIRLFLAGYDLTPTMRDVNKKFSVRYFLNLVLVDEEDRRYFKQQEIVLWRKAPEKIRKRTNFHQRYESPESRPTLSAEQPEM